MTYTSKAEALADTFELARMAAEMAGRSAAAGLDPSTYRGIIGAVLALGGRPGSVRGAQPWRTDHEMLAQLADLTGEVGIRRRQAHELEQQVTEALERAGGPPAGPRERHLKGVRFDCETALEILHRLRTALAYAAERLEAVPGELGETYAELYATVAAGGKLPHDGRFLTGGRLQTYPSVPAPSGPLSVRAEPPAHTDAARTETPDADPHPPARTDAAAPAGGTVRDRPRAVDDCRNCGCSHHGRYAECCRNCGCCCRVDCCSSANDHSIQPADRTAALAGGAVRDRIRAAYRQLAAERGDFVSITELRGQLPDVPRAELDAALVDLYRKQDLNLVPRSNQRALTDADRAAAVRCGGEFKHLISIER